LVERFAYVIAFKGDAFVMVRHKGRKWEMPGGRLLEGEDHAEGARREFIEETGMPLTDIIGEIPLGREGGRVLVGIAGRRGNRELSEEIAEVRSFSKLPDDLSFPLVEYESMLARAKAMLETFKKRKAIGRNASPLNTD
jgi:8-oxo-dGTP diphosphatase